MRHGARDTRWSRLPLARRGMHAALAVALAVLWPQRVAGAAALDAETWGGEPEMFLMALVVDDHELAAAVPAFRTPDGIFVSFEPLLAALEFPIRKEGRTWVGWARSPDNVFRWTTADASPMSVARDADKPRVRWLENAEGTCVATGLLEEWFDLELTADTRRQVITIQSEDPLPFQQRELRRLRRARFAGMGSAGSPLEVRDVYRWITLPMFDVTAFHLSQQHLGSRSDTQHLSVDVGMDLLKHSVIYNGSVNRVSGSPTDERQRLTFSRAAPTEGATLGWGLHRYSFGDVFSASSDLVNAGGAGTGVVLERRRGGSAGVLNEVTITGDATPGWDVELHRNGVLIAFGVVDRDGRYVFEGLDTVFGENVFVAKLYGPQGQVREDRHVHWAGGVDLEKGDHAFRLSHVDFRERFIDGDRNDGELLAADALTDVRASYGVTDDFQLGAAYSWAGLGSRQAPGKHESTQYATLFGRARLGRGLLLAEVVQQRGRGFGWSLQYLTSFHGHDFSFTHQSFDDYESPRTLRDVALRSLSQATVSGPLSVSRTGHYAVRATHRQRTDGEDDLRLFARVALGWGRLALTSDLEYSGLASGDGTYRGELRASARWKSWHFSGRVTYEPMADSPLKQATLTARWNISPLLHGAWTVREVFGEPDTLYLESVLSARLRGVDVSLTATASSDDSWSVGVNVLLHLGHGGRGRGIFLDHRTLARSGRAELAVFVDRDNDGVRDHDEEPVTWVAYKGQESTERAPGIVSLAPLPAATPVLVRTRDLRFEDPFLVPRESAVQVFTHAGSSLRVDVPVVITGEVAGYLLGGPGLGAEVVRGVEVSLHGPSGREVAVTRSEHDGYFSFVGVPVGSYEVRVWPARGSEVFVSRAITLNGDEGYAEVEDIHLPVAFAARDTPDGGGEGLLIAQAGGS